MKKGDFISGLEDYLELTNLNEDSTLDLSSINILSVIALVDESFDIQLKSSDLKQVSSVQDLMNLIGIEKFND